MAKPARRRRGVLDPERVVETLVQLQNRIEQRFPGAGLAMVCGDLLDTARKTQRRASALGRPFIGLRVLVAAVVLGALALQVYVAHLVDWRSIGRHSDAVGMTEGLEAAVNLAILAFGAIWFLARLESRLKRARTLRHLYELRSIAHVIDMYQLTKDPSMILTVGQQRTPASPVRVMNEFELTRYLDYCSEMLALISKLAALYAERTRDAEVMDAINDVEVLTSDLGRKIWQKITILSQLKGDAAAGQHTSPT